MSVVGVWFKCHLDVSKCCKQELNGIQLYFIHEGDAEKNIKNEREVDL